MANVYGTQLIKDSNKSSIIKLTGFFDGTGQETNNSRIAANTLSYAMDINNLPLGANTPKPFYGLSVSRVWVNTNIPSITLYWNGVNSGANTILNLSGAGQYNIDGNFSAIPNPGTQSGDIGITTNGAVANNSYTIILELHKDNNYYSAGQFNDPNAFNYKPYAVTP